MQVFKKVYENLHFFLEIACQFGKRLYLCTRFRKRGACTLVDEGKR